MHRRGHFGLTLLGIAPVLYVLLPDRPFLALLSLGVFVIEPLPDYDQHIDRLEHRKTSHSLFTAVVIGGVCACLGWIVGTYVTVPTGEWMITAAVSADSPAAWVGGRLAALDAVTLTIVGLCVGAGGILLHLAGDVITVSGIQPFLPFSRQTVSVSSLYADNPVVNVGLFLLGWVAILLVSLATTPLGDAARQLGEILLGSGV